MPRALIIKYVVINQRDLKLNGNLPFVSNAKLNFFLIARFLQLTNAYL